MQNTGSNFMFSLETFKINSTNDYKTRQKGLRFAGLPWLLEE